MNDPLDALLAQRLEDVADNGFSARITTQLASRQRRDATVTWIVVALAALPLLWLLPVPSISETAARLAPALAGAAPLALACGLLLLTLSFENLLRER
ncbi:MAG TPA: hypothetical protein VHU18_07850 [Rhizomicrobium sp.]|jgi:hypothetical protein|nr:hypothetical protein [Rhizomicrobium sp.]